MAQKKRSTPNATTTDSQMLLVLGMHSSGTSALSGILHRLGCALPKNVMQTEANKKKGRAKSDAISHFNDQLLAEAGSSWHDWQPLNPDWFTSPVGEAFLPKARDLLTKEFGTAPLSVLKDPRICRILPFWRQAAHMADMKTLPVLIHRNPFKVAKSLQKRHGIDIAEGLAIWLRHVLDAEASTRKNHRSFVSYDQILKNWPAQVDRIQKDLNLVFPRFGNKARVEIDEFLAPKLRKLNERPQKLSKNPALSTWVHETYQILERWAKKGEVKADYETLDQIRDGFDAASPLFSQLVGPQSALAQSLTARIDSLQAEQKIYEDELAARDKLAEDDDAARQALQSQLDTAKAQTAKLQAELSKHETLTQEHAAARATLKNEIEKNHAQISALETKYEATQRTLGATEVKLDQSNIDLKELQSALSQAKSALAQRRAEADEAYERAGASEQARIEAERALDTAETALADMILKSEKLDATCKSQTEELSKLAILLSDAVSEKSQAIEAAAAAQNAQAIELNEKAQIIAQRDAELDEKTKVLTERDAELDEKTKALTERDAELVSHRTHIAHVDAERLTMQSHIQNLEDEVLAFKRSTFWRMTKPLRLIVDTLRGQR